MLSRFAQRAILSSRSTSYGFSQRFSHDDSKAWVVKKAVLTEVAVNNDPSKVVVTECDSSTVPLPTPFNGPLRDHVNFPERVRLDVPVPSRLCLIPESWFKFLYPKIGVTGPYTLGIGFTLFLVSKEIFLVNDSEFQHLVAFICWIYIFVKTPLGLKLRDFVWDPNDGVEESLINLRKYSKDLREEAIAHEKEEQWRLEGKQLLFNAKKENVALQLEATYRKNLMDAYHQLKRRLDYQVEVSKIDSRIKQQFMVQWVLDRVNESIGQTSEKENLKQCIANLNTLAAKV